MADTLTEGLIIPAPNDAISNTGVQEIRTLGNTTNTALASLRELAVEGPYEAVPAGASANDYTQTGNYGIEAGSVAQSVSDFPIKQVGLLQVRKFDAVVGTVVFQMFTQYGANNTWIRVTESAGAGTFTRWSPITNGTFKGTITDGSINDYPSPLYNGTWSVPDGAVVADTPDGLPGVLMPVNVESKRSLQVYFGFHRDGARIYTRVRDWDYHSTWQAWEQVGGKTGSSVDAAANPLLIQQFAARRQGTIGTNGKGAVAFRMDHNTDYFADLLPEFVSRGLPVSLAVLADEFNPEYVSHSTTTSWELIQDWSHNHGVEIWSHSFTHGPASTDAELEHEIVDSRTFLMEKMPQTIVEGWCMVGVSGDYGGLLKGGGITPENLYGTRAGQLVLSNYAISNGHHGGYYRQLTGNVVQAQAHYSYESDSDATTANNIVTAAAENGEGVVLMAHPDNIGADGRISRAEFIRLLDHVVSLRDAGDLEVVTMGGLSIVDPNMDRRPNLWVNADFSRGLNRWVQTGWQLNENGISSSTVGASIRQSIGTSRRAALLGGPREVRAEVETTTGCSLKVRVFDSSTTSNIDTQREIEVPAGGATLRLPFVIPYIAGGFPTMNLNVELVLDEGEATIRNISSPAI